MKKTTSIIRSLAILGVVIVGTVGCAGPRMGRYNVKVDLAESLSDSSGILPSVEVHLLALDNVKGRILQGFSMSDYWNPNRKRDAYAKHVMRFGERKPGSQVLMRSDPIWKRWGAAGATYLFVLADLPGLYSDKEHVKDPRRLILPLSPKRWRNNTIQVTIEKSGVYCNTPRVAKPAE